MAALLLFLRLTRLGALLRAAHCERPRRRAVLSLRSFFLTFAIVRAWCSAFVHQIPPFHTSSWKAVTFIICVRDPDPLAVGYGWLCEVGNAATRRRS